MWSILKSNYRLLLFTTEFRTRNFHGDLPQRISIDNLRRIANLSCRPSYWKIDLGHISKVFYDTKTVPIYHSGEINDAPMIPRAEVYFKKDI